MGSPSPTKRPVPPAVLAALVDAACDGAGIESASEIAEGSYNTAYRVVLSRAVDGVSSVVVKIAPDPATPVLTYEHDIMRTEARFYELAAAQSSAPLPVVLHTDFSRTLLDRDFMVMSLVPGRLLTDVALSDAARSRFRQELGGVVASLHRISGDGFGYLQGRPAPLQPTWREAFVGMMSALLDDAARYGVSLTPSPDAVRALVDANARWLDDVRSPALVHFDLWDGNLFVAADAEDGNGSSPRLCGIIDGERAFWGDPHADFVSLALFGDITADAAFLAGYRAAGGQVDLGESFTRRMTLYRAYLSLLMTIEGVPREYGPDWSDGIGRLAAEMFAAEMASLGSLG